MVFLFIFLILILMIITIKIKIECDNFKFTSLAKQHLKNDYQIKITIYTFYKIPIFKTKIDNKKMKSIIKSEKVRKIIKSQEINIIEKQEYIDKKLLKELKNIRLEIKEINLAISIGTEDASLTAFIIPIISTVLAIFLSKKVKKYNKSQVFSIVPIYINQNLINIEFSGIFQIKMIHIIDTICRVNKRRKGDKNERTSNRRSYDYGYE